MESFWFNVYYGGKPVANTDLGLTVDEVAVDGERIGCGAGGGLDRSAVGDMTGNGYDERLWWGDCQTGPCFQSQGTTDRGRTAPDLLGDGAWFSLETHRHGVHLADVDGDGRSDAVYRGRCNDSEKCWRVHRTVGGSLGPGEDWGDGAWIKGKHLVFGDWDGDGYDDVAYRGLCGDRQGCWRVHRSTGKNLADAESWGVPPDEITGAPRAEDVTGDGRADLVYAAACDGGQCWFVQESEGDSFGSPKNLGVARPDELERLWLFDGDSDGRADLITVRPTDSGGSRIEMRTITPDGLNDPNSIHAADLPVEDVLLRRRPSDRMLEALVVTGCDEGPCTERFLAVSGRLVTPEDYGEALTRRLIRDLTAEPNHFEVTVD